MKKRLPAISGHDGHDEQKRNPEAEGNCREEIPVISRYDQSYAASDPSVRSVSSVKSPRETPLPLADRSCRQ